MNYTRNIKTKVDPQQESINNFLAQDFQGVLNNLNLRYELESARTVKTGKTYDDQIYKGIKRKSFEFEGNRVADIKRNVSENGISLEIRVLKPEYSDLLKQTIGQYKNISVSLKE